MFRKERVRFFLTAALVGIWWGVLIVLVIWTANPVVLNRRQLMQSDCVVTGILLDAPPGTVRVLKVWRGGLPQTEIHVVHLKDRVRVADRKGHRPRPGEKYVFPLKRRGTNSYLVTPRTPEETSGVIYPATPAVREQLREMFEPASRSPRQ